MRAATRESTRERKIRIMASVLVISIGFLVPKAAAQSDKYPTMAPLDQYLMERNAEILLARSAAPDSISSDATVLVLVWQGRCVSRDGHLLKPNDSLPREEIRGRFGTCPW